LVQHALGHIRELLQNTATDALQDVSECSSLGVHEPRISDQCARWPDVDLRNPLTELSPAAAPSHGVSDVRSDEVDEGIGVAEHDSPAVLFTTEHVRRSIRKWHERRAPVQSRLVSLNCHAARQVIADPGHEVFVRAPAATTAGGIAGRRPTETSRNSFPADKVGSIRAQDCDILAMREQLTPEAPVPSAHARIRRVDLSQQASKVNNSR
jgi:hypothetical protein